MGMAATLVMWVEQIFVPHPMEAPHGPVISEELEDVWKCWHTYYTPTDDRGLPIYIISSPVSLLLRWAKNVDRVPNTV